MSKMTGYFRKYGYRVFRSMKKKKTFEHDPNIDIQVFFAIFAVDPVLCRLAQSDADLTISMSCNEILSVTFSL